MSQPLTTQLTTFYIGHELFGVKVLSTQEVTGKPTIVPVPLAPSFVRGLINLRGQIATALDLSELFYQTKNHSESEMSVVCKADGNLVSLIVDSIGDVVEIEESSFEHSPETISQHIKKYIKGVYKLENKILSLIDLDSISNELSQHLETTTHH